MEHGVGEREEGDRGCQFHLQSKPSMDAKAEGGRDMPAEILLISLTAFLEANDASKGTFFSFSREMYSCLICIA